MTNREKANLRRRLKHIKRQVNTLARQTTTADMRSWHCFKTFVPFDYEFPEDWFHIRTIEEHWDNANRTFEDGHETYLELAPERRLIEHKLMEANNG